MRLDAIVRALGSRRLGVALMLAWMALIVVWVVPFEFYGLPDDQIRAVVYGEPFFQFVYAILAVNTVACILFHAGTVLRRVRRVPDPAAAPKRTGDCIRASGEFSVDQAAAALRRAGYRTLASGDGWVWGVKHRYAPLGTLAFHVGILACIAAIGLSFDPSLRFEGSLVLAEGESYAGDEAAYLDTPEDATAKPVPLAFTVEDIEPRFHEDVLLFTALGADVRTGGRARHVTVSRPWIPRADTLVTLSDFGYALEAVAGLEGTATQASGVYKLKAFPSGQQDVFDVSLGAETYRVYVRVYGDYVDRDGVPGVRSFNTDNPYLLVSVARALSASGERMLVRDVLLPVGGSVSLPQVTIEFPGLRHYGVFRVTRSLAAPFVLLALTLLAAGTVVRLGFPRTEAIIFRTGEEQASTIEVEVRSDVYGSRPRLGRSLAERVGPV